MTNDFQTMAKAWQAFGQVGVDMDLPADIAEEPAFYAGGAAVLAILARETDTSALFDRIAALMLEIRSKAQAKAETARAT